MDIRRGVTRLWIFVSVLGMAGITTSAMGDPDVTKFGPSAVSDHNKPVSWDDLGAVVPDGPKDTLSELPQCQVTTTPWNNCQATITLPNGAKYVGEFRDDKFSGQGTFTLPNGEKYVGEWRDGRPNGQGTYTLPNGEKYVGGWRDFNHHGQGTEYLPNGETYVGEFRDGKRTGHGTYTFPDGTKYIGEWRDGKHNGHGTYIYPSGAKYVGEYRDDKRNGQGVEYFPDGSIARSGTWLNGQFVGQTVATVHSSLAKCPVDASRLWDNCEGTHIFPDGAKYVGEWRNNQFNGQGAYTFPDGVKYVGEFRDGKSHGQGTLTLPSGMRHVGEWRDNMPNGQGTEYMPDGSIGRSGIWSNGALVKSASVPSGVSPHPAPATSSPRTEVSLVADGGTFKVPVLINGIIPLKFTVDSGAADVSIPADVVLVMMRTGTLRDSDFLGTQTYRLADGSTVPSKTFRIRTLTVGDRVIENVTGSMTGVDGSLLLGQSFLSRFRRWSINNSTQVLELE